MSFISEIANNLMAKFFRIPTVAALIMIGGWLGQMLAVPPGYASPIWPPAGLALAALLIWGKNVLPGVWLGSFALNLWIGSGATGSLNATALYAAIGIATGSSLQALAAVWLSEKFLRPGVPILSDTRSIFAFLGLTGPLACLIAPTAGVGSLLALGVMPQTAAFFSWWNWWVGDSLGVIIVAPLIFCLMATTHAIWRSRRMTMAIPLIVALLLLVTVFVFVFRTEQSRLKLQFEGRVAPISKSLAEHFDNAINGTRSMRSLYDASQSVERAEFSVFAKGTLQRHLELQALSWVPLIPGENLEQLEKEAHSDGLVNFRTRELAADQTLVPVQRRPEYFPVLFIEPMAGNEEVPGFDLASESLRRQAIDSARASGDISVTQRIHLVQEKNGRYSVLVIVPVYAATSGRADFKGVITGVVRLDQLIDRAFKGLDLSHLHIAIRDLSASTGETDLYADAKHPPQLQKKYSLREWTTTIPFGDRSIQLVITPDADFVAVYGSWLPWITLIGGLIFTGLLNIYLLTTTGRTAQIEALVDETTRELRENEAKLSTLIESEPECVKLLARDGTLLHMNRAGLDMIEADSLEQVQGQPMAELVLPQYRMAFRKLTLQVFDGQPGELQFEIQGLKGGHRWLDTHAVPMRDTQGNITSLLGLTRDISRNKQMEATLHANEDRFRSMLETSPSAVRIARAGGFDVIFANQRYAELINAKREDVSGVNPKAYYAHQADYEEIARRIGLGEQVFDRLVELNIPGYGTKWALASYLPIQYEGEPAVLGWFYDITDRKLSEENLKLSARVFAEAHEGISITDAAGRIIDVNPMFCEITGYNREEVIGQNPRLLSSGRQSPEFYADMWKALDENGHWKGEIWNRRKSGELYAELLTISALKDDDGHIQHYVGLFSDITHVKQQQQTLELMAHYDVLTKLPNRALFADRFSQAIARSRRDQSLLAICYLDLDGFKQINDSLGHEAGDDLLIEVSGRIKSSLREEDTVSRLGGDEFALLMGDIDTLEQCEQTLARLHRAIAEPYLINNQPVRIAASSGVTLFPLDDVDPDTLLRHADQAMYQAKAAGRNRYHLFDASSDQQIRSQFKQLSIIEEAFSRNEFCLYYQPKVDSANGRVMGAEALIRWLHPERGVVPPMDFLPAIENTPFEIVVGNWVIDQALRQIDVWNQHGMPIQVSVNISPAHLQWPHFTTKLEEILASYPRIPSQQLQLEILESSAMGDLSAIGEVIRTCRDALGVSIALDDFGTGYSSLTYLRRLPANTIKIDQSFVRDMIDDPNDYAIVEGVIGLAHAFHRDVVAEGVETSEHGLMLLAMGCHHAQGYGIARPMPAAALPQWTKDYRQDPLWREFVENKPTEKATMARLMQIKIRRWVSQLEAALRQSPDTDTKTKVYWPIMDYRKCHSGSWILQARELHLFDRKQLDTLDQMHEELNRIGNVLVNLYQRGDLEQAREGIPLLQATLQTIENTLEPLARA